MTLPFDIRLILRSGLFGGSSAAAWRYHATWHNSFLILLVFVLRFLFGCLALFSFFSALFNSSSCNCGCCGCDCYRCCVVIVPVVAVVAFVLLLVGLCCRLSCFQHQLELSALSALSAGCIDPPVISVVSAKATVDLPNILEHLRSCQSSPEGT